MCGTEHIWYFFARFIEPVKIRNRSTPLPKSRHGRGGFEGLEQGLEQASFLLVQGCPARANGAVDIRTLLGSKAA